MSDILYHCFAGLAIRISLISYAETQDKFALVQYTDIDYRVFTDAARHMVVGGSPYDRHTYRYSPLLAFLLIPNITLHPAWGKLMFSIVDIFVGILIRRIVLSQSAPEAVATFCAATWIYNPLAIVISTRGNADSISAFLVLFAALLIQEKRDILLAGIIHALAIHVRLYPIAFSLPMYLALQSPSTYQDNHGTTNRSVFDKYVSYLIPNKDQMVLMFSCITTLLLVTIGCYWLYSYQFLHESLLYHLSRNDFRHNFSVYFYLLYLTSESPPALWLRALTFLPQLILLIALSFKYGKQQHICFCILMQAIVIVAYNPVLTSQYFIWFVSLIPPCLPNLKITPSKAGILSAIWFGAQLAWLLPAYWLEFRGRNTFMYIWFQGIAFFCANMAVLAKLLQAYTPERIQICKKTN